MHMFIYMYKQFYTIVDMHLNMHVKYKNMYQRNQTLVGFSNQKHTHHVTIDFKTWINTYMVYNCVLIPSTISNGFYDNGAYSTR